MGSNARAALTALVTATGGSEDGQKLCAQLIDRAVTTLMGAPREIIEVAGGNADVPDRLKAVMLLTQVCGSCNLCPRGQALSDKPRGPGRIGRHRRR